MNPNKRFDLKLKGGRSPFVERYRRKGFDYLFNVYTSLDGELTSIVLRDILDRLPMDGVYWEETPDGTLFQVRRKKDKEEGDVR